MIVALIPAHNEEAGIAQTIMSLQSQTIPPDRIVVVADNCTDHTEALALANDAEVFTTVGNTAKKAGALNQALDSILPQMKDTDFVLALDADGTLAPNWIEIAISRFTTDTGAISGACRIKEHPGILAMLQRAEYAQGFRRVARKGGKVDVLSGAAAIFSVKVLRLVATSRGRGLPGQFGKTYNERSLTEDLEITLALRSLGFDPRCFKELVVTTDVMRTCKELYRQRLRWQRGTIDTLRDFGYNRTTKRMWMLLAVCYAPLLVVTLTVFAWWMVVSAGLFAFQPLWLLLLPIFSVDQLVTSWRARSLRSSLFVATLLPVWIYDLFKIFIYIRAAGESIFSRQKIWLT